MRLRVWLKHNHKEDWHNCPACNTPLKWVYDGENWVPCDREPIYYKWTMGGNFKIFKNRELLDGCEIYKSGDGKGFTMGLLPHVYSCFDLNGYGGVKYVR